MITGQDLMNYSYQTYFTEVQFSHKTWKLANYFKNNKIKTNLNLVVATRTLIRSLEMHVTIVTDSIDVVFYSTVVQTLEDLSGFLVPRDLFRERFTWNITT